MRRRETKEDALPAEPQGQGGKTEEEKREAALKELSFTLFQLALARRRVEGIMQSDDLASVVYYRELNFVHEVLSEVHRLLRRVAYGPQDQNA